MAKPAIPRVAQRAPEYQRKAYRDQGRGRDRRRARAPEHHADDRDHHQRDSHQQHAAPLAGRICEVSERRAGILGVNNIEESRDNRRYFPGSESRPDIHFGDAVDDDHGGGDGSRPQTWVHPGKSWSAAEQESHTVGNSRSWPTAAEYFQQRSHLTPSAFSMIARSWSPSSTMTCETMKIDGRSVSNPR